MSGLFSRESAFLRDEGYDRQGPGRGNASNRYGGRSRRGGRGRGNFYNRGGGRNSGRSYLDRDGPEYDEGLGNEGSWSGNSREQRKFTPYRAPHRRPFRGRGYSGRPFTRGGIFDRLGLPSGNGEGSPGGYVGQPAMAASSWSKVTVHNGAQNSKEWLLKTLSAKVHAQLIPVQCHVLGDKTIFFIEDHETGMKLKQLGNLPSAGGELRIVVKPSPPPMQGRGSGEPRFTGRPGGGAHRQQQYRPPMQRQGSSSMEGVASMEQDDSTNDGVIMQCLSHRYDPDTKGLDLSDMYHDDVLKQNGVQGVMYRPEFANAIMCQIVDKCPDLLSLDLSSNRLRQLDSFSSISRLSSLQVLNLSDNQINHVEEISKVASSSVVNLSLEGNSFVNACGDFRKYSSLMREKFPNLQTLDGHVLHSPVKFDLPVANSAALPETKPSYLMNDEVKDFLKSFIEQYYNMYDDEKSREGLLNAYSSEAVFSLSVVTSERLKGPYLGEYTKRGRNIMKVYREKRESLLQHGKLDVVKALNDLPKTKHVPSSFIVDVSQATSSLVVFSLWGLFAEVGHQTPVRAFSRMFVIASSQGSISIVNDQLTVRNATPNQVQMVRESLGSQLQTTSPVVTTPAPVTSPIAGAAATPTPQGLASFTSPTASLLTSTMMQPQPLITTLPSLSPQLPAEPSLEQKQLLITQLAGETGMNQQFSEKCLSENRWQYDKATHAFQCLKDKNAVPQEAFIQ